MSCYENLVMKTQMNYSRHYSTYASGGTAVVLSKQKPLPYEEQIQEFVRRVQEAECIIVGGASGLSAAGGGDFYYSDTPSFREHFGKFADKYGFKGAFSGMMHRFSTRNEHWGYVATFLNTTQNAPIREPYLDLDRILQGKDFHILTTNQDTQFVKIYPEEKVSEIQGDHRFFQCSQYRRQQAGHEEAVVHRKEHILEFRKPCNDQVHHEPCHQDKHGFRAQKAGGGSYDGFIAGHYTGDMEAFMNHLPQGLQIGHNDIGSGHHHDIAQNRSKGSCQYLVKRLPKGHEADKRKQPHNQRRLLHHIH